MINIESLSHPYCEITGALLTDIAVAYQLQFECLQCEFSILDLLTADWFAMWLTFDACVTSKLYKL